MKYIIEETKKNGSDTVNTTLWDEDTIMEVFLNITNATEAKQLLSDVLDGATINIDAEHNRKYRLATDSEAAELLEKEAKENAELDAMSCEAVDKLRKIIVNLKK